MKIRWLLLIVASLLFVSLCAGGRTVDGPVYIVGAVNAGPANGTNHVFATLAGALGELNQIVAAGVNPSEVEGATIVIYPGTYPVTATLNINIPGLTITSLEGADRTQLVAAAPLAGSVFAITAPGVTLEDLQISGAAPAGVHGINVAARDCMLKDLLISAHTGHGVLVAAGAEQLSVIGCDIHGNAIDGINAVNTLWDLLIEDTTVRSNAVNGVTLKNTYNAQIVESTISGNGLTGIALESCRQIAIESSAVNRNTQGININTSSAIAVDGCTFTGNGAASVTLQGSSLCHIAGNTFDQNPGNAVNITGAASTLNVIENNVMTLQAGAAPPNVAAILLNGEANACTIRDNEISGYSWGIALLPGGPLLGNTFSGNLIENTLNNGIQVLSSAGDNQFLDNTVTSCAGNGLFIEAGSNDIYQRNSIALNTLSGIVVGPADTVAINGVVLGDNTVQQNGVSGIEVITNAKPGVTNLLIDGNQVLMNDGVGINIVDVAIGLGLRILSNEVAANEGIGIQAVKAPGVRIRYNRIHDNRDVGIKAAASTGPGEDLEISHNSVFANHGGGLELDLGGDVAQLTSVVARNSIYSNLSFGVQLNELPNPKPNKPSPLVLPYPENFSLGNNWWGISVGPSGFFAGTGNAVLGLTQTRRLALAPILSAPPTTSEKRDAEIIVHSAQVSVLRTFAAGEVVVDRTDSTGFKLTFSGVSPRADGWVSIAPFSSFATEGEPWASLGTVVKSSAVLVSGLSNGMVQIACEFSDIANPGDLKLYAYKGGGWAVDEETGEWMLSGGSWVELTGCVTVGSEVVYAEIPVVDLLGDVKALALASAAAE